MKAQELRIGNWVLIPNSLEDEIIIPTIDKRVLAIQRDGLLIHSSPHESKDYVVPLKHTMPIPLTEDWLKKFGFEKDSHFKNRFSIDIIEGEKLLLILHINIHSKEFEINAGHKTLCVLEYVHQLQNLYHALTGEELTL